MNVFYEEEGHFKIASVMAENPGSMQVESPTGKGIEGIRSMCAHPSTFPQGFPGGDQLFTDSPLNTHHNISHPDIHGTGERSFERAVRPTFPLS